MYEPSVKNRDFNDCPIDRELHGVDGAIHTSMGTWQVSFEKALLPTLDEVSGFTPPKEPYNGSHSDFYRSIFTTDRTSKPIRSYAGNRYLVPNAGCANLRVLTATIARRLILEKDQHGVHVATSVECSTEGLLTRLLRIAKSFLAPAPYKVLSSSNFQASEILMSSRRLASLVWYKIQKWVMTCKSM